MRAEPSQAPTEADRGAGSAGPIAPACGGGMEPLGEVNSARAGWVATYRGRPVTELTRDELVEAYTRAAQTFTELCETQLKMDEVSALLASRRPVGRW